MDLTLAKTIEGLSSYNKQLNGSNHCTHGDRVETLAGAIVGSLNNTRCSYRRRRNIGYR
jgi:UDP-N-acetylglucosamine 2-epimerase (hydrolysing)